MQKPGAFDAPWHARLFALTVGLSEGGLFGWPDWTRHFGAALAAQGATRPIEGGDDYYRAWLDALESFAPIAGIASRDDLAAMFAAWRRAYLATPHGQPVRLGGR